MIRLICLSLIALTAPALALTPPDSPKPIVELMLDKSSTKVVKITLAPGGVLPTHTTPVHATVIALSGTGTVVIGEKKEALPEGGAVFLPKAIPHSVINAGQTPLVMVVHHLKAAP